ncbi:MAG TPA: hypothetical protein VF222_10750 [Nitrososphaeraceae archaeon]
MDCSRRFAFPITKKVLLVGVEDEAANIFRVLKLPATKRVQR